MRSAKTIQQTPIIAADSPSRASPNSLEPLLTAKEVAPLLGVGVSTVYEWQRKGLVPYIRLPGHGIRFRASDLQVWIESRLIPSQNSP